MSAQRQLRILITGCTPGGTGAALAIAFHNAGHHVYATARDQSKMMPLEKLGIETVALDITSTSSIASAVSSVTSSLPDGKGLDMLVNNAAGSYTMPIADASLDAAKEMFNVNVWSQVAVTQAFLPLLLKSAAATSEDGHLAQVMIVNHTSVGSVTAIPFQGIYNSSKAAFASLSDTMRLELAPFGIHVVELKTAGVKTNLISNNKFNTTGERLPEGSIYEPARDIVERAMSQDELRVRGISPGQWASEVSSALLAKDPPRVIWRGESALLSRVASMLPAGLFEGMLKKMTKLDVVENIIKEGR
ncbi:Short-chain dehydrogenase cctT [Colletotrichum siamense]|uniref:Short-chain dehydrogenase cctT n=1 Tax=Colletotrichum siamense TaxID=690259 RepID=A0A9P5F2U5_COLSI|nr:Short-chain dehydrogenase cctT [Colletotrichum siamense]KAF4866670.1 Short-chain dehydrogenase cctT [Colletotrichum siamense]